MPRYDYFCQKCQKTFEVSMTFQEKDKGIKPQCPFCNSDKNIIQVFGNIGILSGGDKKGGENPPPTCGFSGQESCCCG